MSSVPLSWLYVPGHRSDRVAKALASQAHAVVIDLEDAVPADQKDAARATVASVAARRKPGAGPQLWVRVNDVTGPWGEADMDAVTGLALDGLRLPRCERPEAVAGAAQRTRLPLQLLLETARGLSRALELAAAHPAVAGLGLGEADLSADLRVTGDSGLDWARGYVVMAARAVGLPSPVQSVYTDVADLEGLRASSVRGRQLGFVGRSVVHPRQVPVVHEVFTPTEAERATAMATVRTADDALARGEAAVLDEQGRFIDPAVVARARVVLDLAGHSTSAAEPQDSPGGTR